MADYPDKTSDRYVRESTYRVEPAPSSDYSMWFIIGGVVVALLILFAIFAGSGEVTTTPNDPSVTIQNDVTPPADPNAIAPEAGTTAPADNVAPPADEAAPPADTEATPAPAPADTESSTTAPAAGN